MVIKHKLSLDLQHAGSVQRIDAVQGDFNSRVLEISLYVDGAPLELPGDTSAALRYCKSDGAVGIYDTLPDGAPAAAISRNVVTITLAPAMLAAAGSVFAQLRLAQGGKVVATFAFIINVLADPSCGTTAVEDYMRLSIEEQAKNAVEVANSVRDDADAGKFNGNKIFDITGAPAPDLGMAGDWAIDTNTADLYCKEDTTWKQQGNLRGPVGGSMPVDDDQTSKENLWTSEKVETEIRKARKEAIDSCAPPFEQTGPIVQGHLVPGYSMEVISHITPWQEGEGDPSPTNVRPIKGWTELKMVKCGKNLFELVSGTSSGLQFEMMEDENIHVHGVASRTYLNFPNAVELKEGTKYTLSISKAMEIRVGIQNNGALHPGKTWFTFTPNAKNAGRRAVYLDGLKAGEAIDLVLKIQVEIGSTPTDIEPYSGENYTRRLPEEIFGGSYNWLTGKLNPWTSMIIDESTPLREEASKQTERKRFVLISVSAPTSVNKVGNIVSNTFKPQSANTGYLGATGICVSSSGNVIFDDMATNTLVEFRVKLNALKEAGTPVVIAFEPKEQKTVQLSLNSNILSRNGETTAYSNSGNTTVIARADPNYLRKNQDDRIATLEEKITQMMEVK